MRRFIENNLTSHVTCNGKSFQDSIVMPPKRRHLIFTQPTHPLPLLSLKAVKLVKSLSISQMCMIDGLDLNVVMLYGVYIKSFQLF